MSSEGLGAYFKRLRRPQAPTRVIALDAEFQSFMMPPDAPVGEPGAAAAVPAAAAADATMEDAAPAPPAPRYIRNAFNDRTNPAEPGPYSFIRELGLLSFTRDGSGQYTADLASGRHFPLLFHPDALPGVAPFTDPEALQYTFCTVGKDTRDAMSKAWSSIVVRLPYIRADRLAGWLADPTGKDAQEKAYVIHEEVVTKRHVWEHLFPDTASDVRQQLEAIAAVTLPAAEEVPAPAPPPAAAATDDVPMPDASAVASPAPAPAPAPPARPLLPDDTVRLLLESAKPVDAALFRLSRERNMVPRSSVPAGSLPAFDACYRLYDADATRRTPGVLLASDGEVRAFLTALVAALSDEGTLVLVKGSGDLPVVANSCLRYGVPFNPADPGLVARVLDISTDASYRFFRATMGNGTLGVNAEAALALFRAVAADDAAAAAAAAAPATPAVAAVGSEDDSAATTVQVSADAASATAPVAAGEQPAAGGVVVAEVAPVTPVVAALPKPPPLKLACLRRNPRVARLAADVLALEAVVARVAAAAPPAAAAPADPLSLYAGGLFEPTRAHNALVDCYFTVVVGALTGAAGEEVTQAHAAVAAEEALRWKAGRVSKLVKAAQEALDAALTAPVPPPTDASPAPDADAGAAGGGAGSEVATAVQPALAALVVDEAAAAAAAASAAAADATTLAAAVTAATSAPLAHTPTPESLAALRRVLGALGRASEDLTKASAVAMSALDAAALFRATGEGSGWREERVAAVLSGEEGSQGRKRRRDDGGAGGAV